MTYDKYWGCGVNLKFAKNTKPTSYPGENVLGLILEKIRDNSDCQDTIVLSTSKKISIWY